MSSKSLFINLSKLFSSPEISEDDEVNNMQVHSYYCGGKTIDILNLNNIQMICSERDKMKLRGIIKRHPLLFHFNRTLWCYS